MSIEERVIKIIAAEQHMDRDRISSQSTFEELGVDSLDSVNIVFALEDEFKIVIPDSLARQMKSVGQVVDILTRYLENPEAFKAEVAATLAIPTAGDPPAENR